MGIRISKRIRRLMTSLLVISTIFASAYLLGWSSLLSVSQVSVSGSSAVNLVLSELSQNGIEPKIGDQLARVDVRSIKRTLNQLDWISDSDVSRNWFDKKLSIFSRMARANRGKTKLNDFSPYHVETSKVLLEQELRS